MTYRNKFSEAMNTQRRNADLLRGASVFRFAPPPDLPPGMTLADLRVLTPGGQVITWASGYYQTTPQVEIAAVELEKTILPPGDEPVVRGRVKFSAEVGAGDQLDVRAWDLHDRLVGQKTFAAAGSSTPFEAALPGALSMAVTVEVRLNRGRQTLDKRTQTVLLLKNRTWNPRECCQYEWYSSPIPSWTLPYLYDFGRRRAGLIGATSLMDNPLFARLDLEAGAFTTPLSIWDMSDRKYHEKSNAYAQLETPGFLTQRGYRALVLPEALALSDQEVAQIGAFAQSGGLVIADNSVGWMNEHCRTLKAGQPIAGLTPVGKVAAAGATAAVASDDPGSSLIYRSRRGKGQAVYLNLSLVPYREERQMGGRGETMYRQLIGGALGLAGICPEFIVEPAGKKQFHGHVVSFTDQDTRYLALIREFVAGEPEDAFTVHLPAAGHVYDVRARKHLGSTDKISTVLYAGAAKIYCLSPRERPAPILTCPAEAARGTQVRCTLGIGQSSGSMTAVRLEVYDPAGKLRSYYSGPRLLPPGQPQAETSFRLALNDPPGSWLLKAVEVSGGRSAQCRLVVRP